MNLSDLKAGTGKALPKAVITAPCLSDACILAESYGGPGSETTAILQYIYQSYNIKPYHKDIAKIVERISVTEMRHHEALGGMIVELGGNPVIGARDRFWTGANVNYCRNINEIMRLNIKAEEDAIRCYRATIDRLQTKSIIPVIEAIIEEEKIHIDTFAEILKYINFWN